VPKRSRSSRASSRASSPTTASSTRLPPDSAVELSVRFITDRHLPDKAIDVIDEAGARSGSCPSPAEKTDRQDRHRGDRRQDCAHPFDARLVRRPQRLRNLDRDLKAVVFGQDAAIDALARAIKMARSGLGNPTKPIGSFLFRARPASARPRSPSNWRTASATSCYASTCRNTWSGTRSRA
jgi:hypothetical protein